MWGYTVHIMDTGDRACLHDTGDLVASLGPEISVLVGILPFTSTRSVSKTAAFLRKTDCVLYVAL